jgi:Tfp pilus assembly protein PilO
VNKPIKLDLSSLKKLPPEIGHLVALGLALLLVVGLLSWQAGQAIQQQESLRSIQSERLRLEQIAVENQQLEQRIRELNQIWEAGRARLPTKPDYAGLVRLLGEQTQARRVSLGALSPRITTGQGVFSYLSSPAQLSGRFPAVLAVMNDLQRAGRVVILEDVSFALASGGEIRAEMVLKAYFIPTSP